MNNLDRIKELTIKMNELKKELDLEKALVLEQFRSMSPEDIALNENKIGGDGIVIQYFPKSKTVSIDSAKLKEDGIYDKYTKVSNRTDFIKVTLSKEGK